jgi:hypothetical protein
MQRKLLSEILAEAGSQPDIATQAIFLKSHDCLPLRQLLKAALDATVKFDVEIPQYVPNPDAPGCSANNLYIESRRLYVFLEGSKVKERKRRIRLMGQILESIDADDAVLLTHVIGKNLSHYGIDAEAVKLAFPGLLG